MSLLSMMSKDLAWCACIHGHTKLDNYRKLKQLEFLNTKF